MEQLVTKAAAGTAAAIIGGKYLDAKFDILHDLRLVKATIGSKIRSVKLLQGIS
jgi:hypothetical protein